MPFLSGGPWVPQILVMARETTAAAGPLRASACGNLSSYRPMCHRITAALEGLAMVKDNGGLPIPGQADARPLE